MLVGAGPQIAVSVKASSVGPAAALLEGRDRAVRRVPFQDAVIRLVGEVDVAMCIAGWAFGELEAAGGFNKRRSRRDDSVFWHGVCHR